MAINAHSTIEPKCGVAVQNIVYSTKKCQKYSSYNNNVLIFLLTFFL